MAWKKAIILLDPLGPFSSAITSHTLFGATCWALAALEDKANPAGNVGALLKSFFDEGPRFAFSGAFPFVRQQDGTPLLYLPAPSLRVASSDIENLIQQHNGAVKLVVGVAKTVSKVGYISQGIADGMRSQGWTALDLVERVLSGEVKSSGELLYLCSEKKAMSQGLRQWQSMVHSTVDRLAGATAEGQLFVESETFYRRGETGLWCALWAEESLYPKLQGALRYLSDTGLGANRTVGKGHFTATYYDWGKWFKDGDAGRRFLSLSDYIPAADHEAQPVAYQLRFVQQKAESRHPKWRDGVYLARLRTFMPGGVFTAKDGQDRLYGRLVPLGEKDGPPFYSGLTIPLWGDWEV